MKIAKYILCLFFIFNISSCINMDIPPMNVVQDKDVFGTSNGISSYMARLYSCLPIEDFRYTPTRLFNHFWLVNPPSCITGEGLSRDMGGASSENVDNKIFSDLYVLIRNCNYFLETIDQYKDNYTEKELNNWKGEVYFVRAVTYHALAKRYGGVPLVNNVLKYPEQPVDQLNVPRSSEEEVWKAVSADFDNAISLLSETNQRGRATKWAAYAFKSRAMLYAGSIAKYNQIQLFDSKNGNKRVCGMDASLAQGFFQQAYDAAKAVEGHHDLYMKDWKAGDLTAQYTNYLNLFSDAASTEAIFVKEYSYPESVHGYDAYNVPAQCKGANGYSSEISPTLDYVEMFDGLPKDSKGHLDVYNADGTYKLYNNTMDIFATAEPRLRATVILPGDQFKGESIEIRRGIYVGKDDAETGKINRLLPEGNTSRYENYVNVGGKTLIISSSNANQTAYTLHDGTKMNPAGASGYFTGDGTCALSGFTIRKWLSESTPKALVLENRATQPWIEMRYAEVLLTRAEAAAELASLGKADYLSDAYSCIDKIRNRAGATLLSSSEKSSVASFTSAVRKERRKELGFENKTWWDMKRWRVADKEQQNTRYYTLMPFYADYAGKYFFDIRWDERGNTYTFDTRWYYQQIPGNAISTSNNLIIQNPGY